MRNHRRKKLYRRITVATFAAAAVGVPSVAMAGIDHSDDTWRDGRDAHQWSQSPTASPTWTPSGGWTPSDGWTHGTPSAPASSTAPGATPSATPTGTPSATPTATVSATAPAPAASLAKVVDLVNAERAKAGCQALTVNADLTEAATAHSADMAAHQNMSHTGSDGSSPGDRITEAGYDWSTYGENVAYGYATPERVMAAWMASAGHKANILNCGFKEIGVGLSQPNSYWTQDFGATR
ncbi:CAP domain-containing protein [Streptomyces sp. B1866]|uniref:CAP domain-containing protein n=1 Tax=Streptomyces sp. B1866 TaxID=3075431 RepID=UPI00288D2739|nr:CAP domain-containing protein [Streptomyces sp. B1866]MDT3398492.1 CAP domain-containing protein [Streptomyces sp. B1866]